MSTPTPRCAARCSRSWSARARSTISSCGGSAMEARSSPCASAPGRFGTLRAGCSTTRASARASPSARARAVSARPMRAPSGRLLHYEGVVEDVTERKRSREELQESNQFRQEIIQGAGEGIVVHDRDLRYIVWNRYMEKM